MRNFLLRFVLVLCNCLLISTTASSQLQKIYLNPKAPGGGKQSQFVDSIRFIPLESKEDIRLGDYYNIQAIEKYFLLSDYLNKRLLIYSKDGRFLKKINYKKLGDFYPNYNEHNNQIVFFGANKNYVLTSKDQIKIQLDWANTQNKRYFKKYVIDLSDPSFTIKKSTPLQSDIIRSSSFYDDYFWQGQITTSPLYKDSVDYEVKLYKNNQLVKGFFPYHRINEPRFLYTQEYAALIKTDTPYVNIIIRPFCDTIYKIVKDSLFPAYHLVTPLENSLPPSFFTKPFKNKTERENFYRNNGWMLRRVYNFIETPKFILFLVQYLSNLETYIYQKQTNTTYRTKNIKPDSSHYNLQLLADYNILRNGDWFYKPQKAGDLLNFFEKNKSAAIPKELESFLKSKPSATSPVIVEYKLKN
jgi:hypothetical protein